MHLQAGSDTIVETMGLPRLRSGLPLGRIVNFASELAWLSAGADVLAARHRVDAWFSPANLLPVAMPRPMVVSILIRMSSASVVSTTERTPHTRRGCFGTPDIERTQS